MCINNDLDLVGIDEVGYGCWAGPLFICALKFIVKPHFELFDSKQLSSKRREALYSEIIKISTFQIGIGTVEEINDLGLAKAYKKALHNAIYGIQGRMLIDGSNSKGINAECVVKGDQKVPVISAASIIAKVQRDLLMNKLALKYPEYGFNKNKGYGTKFHKIAIKKHGFCEIHRVNYKINLS